jgi:hypothetical protein
MKPDQRTYHPQRRNWDDHSLASRACLFGDGCERRFEALRAFGMFSIQKGPIKKLKRDHAVWKGARSASFRIDESREEFLSRNSTSNFKIDVTNPFVRGWNAEHS